MARYQKRQLALLLGWQEIAAQEETEFAREPILMRVKAVKRWTGFDEATLINLVEHKALRLVCPPGCAQGKYLKEQIAALIGMERCV